MIIRITFILSVVAFISGCGTRHDEVVSQLEELKKDSQEFYPVVYATATYLATTADLTPEEAIPLVLDLISMGYHTEARYSIDNLFRNGIFSYDLMALRGLCYSNELQPELALADLERATAGDPGNEKIQALYNQVQEKSSPVENAGILLNDARSRLLNGDTDASDQILSRLLNQDPGNHSALFMKGLIRLQKAQYDSALYYMQFARSLDEKRDYVEAVSSVEQVIKAEETIGKQPSFFSGYLQKSQGLAALGLFDEAQSAINHGLEELPDNRSLLLARALVWVQAGETETARLYIQELEQRGMVISQDLKERILQNPVQ